MGVLLNTIAISGKTTLRNIGDKLLNKINPKKCIYCTLCEHNNGEVVIDGL